VVYGTGARLANGGWIKVANANLGADQDKPLEKQLEYEPDAGKSGEANDKNYDPIVYGNWYQWGRKHDGHQDRKKLSTSTYDALVSETYGVPISDLDDDGQIATGHEAYSKFIQRDAGTNNWRQYPETAGHSATAPANDWTWGNPLDGITDLDPCRSELGRPWRVPTQAEWAQIVSNNTWIWHNGGSNGTSAGYEIKPMGENKLTSFFLPAAGSLSRNGGVQENAGAYGLYCSSTPTNTSMYYLRFDSNSESINAATGGSRSTGLTVRCVSE
jgi:uncharacterized protein (TIGR02145 family)